MPPARAAPPLDCGRCPRLFEFRLANRHDQPSWHNAPVPSFGAADAGLLVVGLAPGRGGANRTGRPFTGDGAGAVLYPALLRHGFAVGTYGAEPTDDLRLVDCRITNAVRCVPPANRPLGSELTACRPFLDGEVGTPPRPRVILALGRVAFAAALRSLGERPAAHRFDHGQAMHAKSGQVLLASYHTSRYNLNTGRLTEAAFDRVVGHARSLLDALASTEKAVDLG